MTQIINNPARETGIRLIEKSTKEIPEKIPISIFCGLPTMVAAEPTFADVANPITYGIGFRFKAITISKTIGVNISTIVSFKNKPDKIPEEKTINNKSWFGVFATAIILVETTLLSR